MPDRVCVVCGPAAAASGAGKGTTIDCARVSGGVCGRLTGLGMIRGRALNGLHVGPPDGARSVGTAPATEPPPTVRIVPRPGPGPDSHDRRRGNPAFPREEKAAGREVNAASRSRARDRHRSLSAAGSADRTTLFTARTFLRRWSSACRRSHARVMSTATVRWTSMTSSCCAPSGGRARAPERRRAASWRRGYSRRTCAACPAAWACAGATWVRSPVPPRAAS